MRCFWRKATNWRCAGGRIKANPAAHKRRTHARRLQVANAIVLAFAPFLIVVVRSMRKGIVSLWSFTRDRPDSLFGGFLQLP
jgi:hypothetical protein